MERHKMESSSKNEAAIDRLFAKRFGATEVEQALLCTLMKASREGHLCVEDEQSSLSPLVHFSEGKTYLKRNWECEQTLFREWKRLTHSSPRHEILPTSLSSMDPEQSDAAKKALKETVTLITGGPGTGKTFVAAQIVACAEESSVSLAAPTGKATANLRRRLGENFPILTLHALLKAKHLYPDLLLVDEASMIDAELMARLFSFVRTGTRLVLLGDPHQLPPVEAGSLFADLVKAYPEHVVELTTCHRTELKEIVALADAVKEGEVEKALSLAPLKPLPPKNELVDLIARTHATTQFLTPLRKGPYGTEELNKQVHRCEKREAMPLLITVNLPSLELYNGDTGLLEGEEVTFSDGRIFPKYLLPRFEPAYLLSVHKSQGSEYDAVTLLLPKGSERFGREMLYTALTRARKQVRILGDAKIFRALVEKKTSRLSGL